MPRHGSVTPGETAPDVPLAMPRRGLAAWPIRRKLIALVAGPLILVLVAGLFFTVQSVSSLRSAQRARDVANTALLTNQLASALNTEMKTTLRWRAQATSAPLKAEMVRNQQATDAVYAQLGDALGTPAGGAWGEGVGRAKDDVTEQMSLLPFVRGGAQKSNGLVYVQLQYTQKVQAALGLMTALTVELATTSPNADTVQAASTIGALALASDSAAQESVRLTTALREGRISVRTQQNLQELKVSQGYQLDQAAAHASPDQVEKLTSIRSDEQTIDGFRQAALALVNKGGGELLPQDRTNATTQANTFADASWQRVRNLDQFTNSVIITARDQAAALARDGLIRTGIVSFLAVLALLLGSALVAYVARTVTGPMRRLRSAAVDAATVRLPALVRQIEREGSETNVVVPPVLPPGTVAGPETLEVAQAVDGLAAEAVRLATAQVRLRHALDEAFVSMSRRSQSMVEKQLVIIDELESTEEDPDQLRNLFRLDHLAARMRRYNDNLLVLAGSSLRTRSAAPVPIADVFRAATSEMEQYERVRLQPVNGVAVNGPVAGGLVHLLAELLDNAAMYSPPTSPILMAGTLAADGGLHLEITDSGVGIPASELAELNSRLATPGSIDTQVPSRMGLYVVARLAQRGGFGVRLSPRTNAAGTVAEVDVPPPMVVSSGRPGLPGQGPGGGGSARPDGPRVPGQPSPGIPEPGRSPVATGGMRLDPALRLTNRSGGSPSTSPRGIPVAPSSPSAPMAPAASGAPVQGTPPMTVRGGTNGAVPGGLPSRRPGAALAANPLAARPGGGGSGGPGAGGPGAAAPDGGQQPSRAGFDPFGSPATPPSSSSGTPSAGTAAAAVGGVAAARAGLPPGSVPPPSARSGDADSAPPFSLGAPSSSPAGPSSPPSPSSPQGRERAGGLPTRTPGASAAPAPQRPASPPPGSQRPAPPSPAAEPRWAQTPDAQPAPSARSFLPSAPPSARPPAPSSAPQPPAPEAPAQTPGRPPAGPRWAQAPEAPAPAPAPQQPRFEAPLTSELPRRSRGDALAGTPLAAPRAATPTPLDGIQARRMFGEQAEEVSDAASGDAPQPADDGADPGQRPVRAFAQPRSQAPARPPFRPGATSAQAGASAATAAAAAARARAAAGGRPSTPGSGLFAATGPATLPGGVVRPSVSVPLGPSGTGPSGAGTGPSPSGAGTPSSDVAAAAPGRPTPPQAPPAAPAAPPAAPPVVRSGGASGQGRPTFPLAPIPPLGEIERSGPERGGTDRAYRAGRDYQAEGERSPERGYGVTRDHGAGNGTASPLASGLGSNLGSGLGSNLGSGLGGAESLSDSPTPIFDSISVWFETEPGAAAPIGEPDRVIDLRDAPAAVSTGAPAGGVTGRWAALGDQRWLATNARAAAEPEIAGNTEAGLPRRQPGANLLPSAVEAAPGRVGPPRTTVSEPRTAPAVVGSASAVGPRPDPDAVRGRLGSYQRGLTTARRARHLPGSGGSGSGTTRQALGETESRPQDVGQGSGDQGGDQ